MAKKTKLKLMDLYTLDELGHYQCQQCIYSTPHANNAKRHAQTEHLAEFEPIQVVVPKKGVPDDSFEIIEEVENG
jgi:hypothetical protein